MSEHLLRMCGLTKEQVANMTKPEKREHPRAVKYGYAKPKRTEAAYNMVQKGSSVSSACQSWGVNLGEFNAYALAHGLPLASAYIKANPSKSQLAYEDAKQIGVTPACKKHGVTRFAMYAYARRYGLETPTRARFA